MRSVAAVVFYLISLSVFAQTPVSGNQSGTWYLTGSTYQVTGDVTVPAGETLTIEAGVEVEFQGNYKLTVNGNLQAIGTETDTILFTAIDAATGWHGIRLTEQQNGSTFIFCRFENGKTVAGTFPDQHGGAIMLNNCDAYFENCLFVNNEAVADDTGMGGAIYALNPSEETQILHCSFINNYAYGEGGAIKFSGDTGAHIEWCVFENNTVLYGGGAICLYGCYDTRITNSLFYNNTTTYSSGGAVFIEGYSSLIRFVNSTMYGNNATGGDGGAVDIAFSDASFTNSIIYNNQGAYSDNIYLDFGYAEINYCNTPFPDGAEGNNNINTDALFVDAASGDFHLTPQSPCIDAGIDSLTITTAFDEIITVVDMDSSEYYGPAPDMGCYEFDPTTAIPKTPFINMMVYPNPTTGIINIKNEEHENVNISVVDFNGKTLVNKSGTPVQNRVDLSALQNGVYIIKIKTPNNTICKKIIKE